MLPEAVLKNITANARSCCTGTQGVAFWLVILCFSTLDLISLFLPGNCTRFLLKNNSPFRLYVLTVYGCSALLTEWQKGMAPARAFAHLWFLGVQPPDELEPCCFIVTIFMFFSPLHWMEPKSTKNPSKARKSDNFLYRCHRLVSCYMLCYQINVSVCNCACSLLETLLFGR